VKSVPLPGALGIQPSGKNARNSIAASARLRAADL
jgi:hypothetical protein